MLRLFAVLGLSALVAAAPAAPVPTHLMPKADPLYFPTRVGTEWVYVENGRESKRVVTAVKDRDDGKVVSFTDTACGRADWLVSGKGVTAVGSDGKACDPVLPMLRLPHAPGGTWEVAAGAPNSPHPPGRFAAHGPEEVKVPAGKFNAIRVEIEWVGNGQTTFWFAPGVGVVKADNMELKSFTLGKE